MKTNLTSILNEHFPYIELKSILINNFKSINCFKLEENLPIFFVRLEGDFIVGSLINQ